MLSFLFLHLSSKRSAMKKIIFFFSFAISLTAIAQNKMLTMEEAMVKNRTTLAPENLKQLQFIYGTADYVYLKKVDGQEVWMKGNFKDKDETVFLTLAQLNEKIIAAGYAELKAMPAIQFNRSYEWIFNIDGSKVAWDPIRVKLKIIVPKYYTGKENTEESKAGYIAYLDNYNLNVAFSEDQRQQVTTDGSKNIVYASSVHRDEFGISKGIFWSNSGKLLAF